MLQSRVLLGILLVAISLQARPVSAGNPTSQPATQPVAPGSPMAFMISYDQLAGEEPASYLAMYLVDPHDEETQRLATDEAKFDAEVGILQKMIQQMWGDDAVDDAMHALGLKSTKDIQSATIIDHGRRATVTFADGTPGPDLIRTGRGWRLNLAAFRQSLGMPLDDYLKQLRQLSKVLPDVADGITAKRLTTSAAVTEDIVKRINAQQ